MEIFRKSRHRHRAGSARRGDILVRLLLFAGVMVILLAVLAPVLLRTRRPSEADFSEPARQLAGELRRTVVNESNIAAERQPSARGKAVSAPEEVAILKREELEVAQRLMKDFPRSDAAVAFVGSVYGQQGNNTEAVKFWNRALELNPKRPDVHNCLGWVALEKGAYEEAIRHWRRALGIDAQLPGVRSSVGFALMALGRYGEAIEELERELKVFPGSAYGHFLLGQAYLQQKDYQRAKKHYKAALGLDQNYANAYYGLSTACARMQERDKAQEYMAKFKKLRAEEMKLMRVRDQAYDDVVVMRQSAAETYMNAAWIYQAQGHSGRSKELMEKARKLDPDNPSYR